MSILKEKPYHAPLLVEYYIRKLCGSMLIGKLRDSEGYFPVTDKPGHSLCTVSKLWKPVLWQYHTGSMCAHSLLYTLSFQPTTCYLANNLPSPQSLKQKLLLEGVKVKSKVKMCYTQQIKNKILNQITT